MNDGMYTNIRNYLEEIASQQRQIVKLLEGMATAQGVVNTSKIKSPVEVMPKASKPDFTVTVEDEQKAGKLPKKGK